VVSGCIIQTAVINKTLRLELDYRHPNMLPRGDGGIKGLVADNGLAPKYDDPQVPDEFACSRRVI
jgi:hypothetical protein